jgi:streptogramin lyase
VLKIDAKTIRIAARWPLPKGSTPTSMGIDAEGRRLFIGCRNKTLIVLNADTGQIVATLPIGAGVDATVYDPVHHAVFSSCGEGIVTVIDQGPGEIYRVAETIPTAPRARTMALDPKQNLLFLPCAQFDSAAIQPGARPKMIEGSFELLIFKKS